jgi:glucokinase
VEENSRVILAGDIGGTNTRLALFRWEDERLKVAEEATFRSRDYGSLDEIAIKFISSRKLSIERASFGIAGPIKNGRCEATNLAWIVDSRQLAEKLAIEWVALINDLEANAYGITMLEANDFVVLNQGAPDAAGNAAIISAGTGLGEAGLFWDGKQHRPFACEGGHTDLAPRNELEMELLRYLLAKFRRVSYERAVSGPGLVNIYDFLRDTGRGQESPRLAEEMRRQNPAAVISKAAMDGTCPLSVQALDLFVSLYGAEAGNLALKIMSTGGVFVGGGIAPKILPKLTGPLFMEAFTTKGRMSPLLKAMPVRIIVNEKTALLGAARCALDSM